MNCVTIERNKLSHLDVFSVVGEYLPKQGSIEIQCDGPNKIHDWHEHPVSEKLVMLAGTLDFEWTDGKCECDFGDVINLPANTPHKSQALDHGAKYIIVKE